MTESHFADRLFHASPNAYLIMRPDFTIIDMNAAFMRATNHRKEDIGRTLFDAFPLAPGSDQDGQHLLKASLKRVLDHRAPDQLDFLPYALEHDTPDGKVVEQRFWNITNAPLFSDTGDIQFIFQHVVDVTAQHLQASAVREEQDKNRILHLEQEQLLRLFEQAPGFISYFNGPNHVFKLANKAYYRLIGHRDLTGMPIRDAVPEVEGQGFFEILDEVFQTGKPFVGRGFPISLQHAPGSPKVQRYVDFVYQPVTGADGSVIGILTEGNDVTEQKLAEDKVRQYQSELETLISERTQTLLQTKTALEQARQLQGDKTHLLRLFSQAPGFIAVLNQADHVFEIVNDAYLQLVGRREVIGKPVREALPEVAGQGFFELLDNVYKTGEPVVGHSSPLLIQTSLDGPLETRYIDFVYQPITGVDGKTTGIFVQGNDVTDQRNAQDEVKRYQNELERMVHERTLELEETQTALQHAQKLESIGKLTGGVAHDFNNVLQIIGGNLQLLNAYIGNNELAAKRLEAAVLAVGRGAKLSSQLLAFARRQPLQPAVINLTRVIRGTDDLLRQALGEAIRIETVIAGGLWNTLLDPHHLENVILNLAINAADAMQGRGKLTIEVGNSMLDDDYVMSEPEVEAGQYVMLAISDTGSGMTPEVMQRAVEPFFTTKPEGEGTGLGLSMVYGFVKQSGGHFRMYSEVGYGTTVRMYFPRSFAPETEVIVDFSGPVVGGTETILVVEDDIAVQSTVVEMLTDLGYSVLKADDAESALNILKSGIVIDLLFTDVVMPGQLRSPELARQAKLIIPGIEVLFTSGYTQNAIVHGGRLDPGVSLLSKPYRREQLARKVRHLLSNRQQVVASANAIVTLSDGNTVSPKSTRLRILVVEDNIDSQQMACEILAILGHKSQGVATAQEAIKLLANDRFDVLFTDIGLPDMSGVELAEKASADRPGLKVIFASGYHDAIITSAHFDPVILPKPYDMAQLISALEKTVGSA